MARRIFDFTYFGSYTIKPLNCPTKNEALLSVDLIPPPAWPHARIGHPARRYCYRGGTAARPRTDSEKPESWRMLL